MFQAAAARAPDAIAIKYFDGVLTNRELDALSDSLASALLARGFRPGDRLVLYTDGVTESFNRRNQGADSVTQRAYKCPQDAKRATGSLAIAALCG
jgi:non-ribosomal peptide synthetase component F